MEVLHNPEVPEHILEASEMIVRYAAGQISYKEYREYLDTWWEKNEEAWQEGDLLPLFLLCLGS
jgi:allophanate hydrolase subunit 1